MQNNKMNFLVIALIMVLPIMLYTFFKAPNDESIITQAASGKPMVIKFSSPMCMECKQLDRVLQTIEPKYHDKITFQKLSISTRNPEIQNKIRKYHINVVPTMIFLDKNGATVKKIEGAPAQSQLEKNLEELING